MFSLASFALPTWQQNGEVFPPKTHGRENCTREREDHICSLSLSNLYSVIECDLPTKGKRILPEDVLACFNAVKVSNDDLCVLFYLHRVSAGS